MESTSLWFSVGCASGCTNFSFLNNGKVSTITFILVGMSLPCYHTQFSIENNKKTTFWNTLREKTQELFIPSVGWPALRVNTVWFSTFRPHSVDIPRTFSQDTRYDKWQWRNLGQQLYFHGRAYIFYLFSPGGHIFPLAFLFLGQSSMYGIWQMLQQSVPDGCTYCVTDGVVFHSLFSPFSWVCHCHRLNTRVCKGWWKYTKSRMI